MNIAQHTSPLTYMVWIIDTTVGQWRRRCETAIAEHDSTDTPPSCRELLTEAARNQLAQVAGRDETEVCATKVGFTRLGYLLPKGARVVGLLDDTGYHSEETIPVPRQQLLEFFEHYRRDEVVAVPGADGSITLFAPRHDAFADRDTLEVTG